MNSRIRMNTESLQEAFPEVYEEFFSKCNIVTSAPGVFHWAGEHAVVFGGPAMSQKMPVRVYVGLEFFTGENKIEFGKIQYFIPSKKRFEDWKFDHLSEKKVLRYLNETINRLSKGAFLSVGFRIHVIYEVPRASGINSSAAFSAALIAALLYHTKAVTLESYQEGLKQNIATLIEKNKSFDILFREAWKMASQIRGGVASGASVLESLVRSRYPIIYFTEGRVNPSVKKSQVGVPYNLEGDYGKIDKIKYWAFNFGDFFGLEKNPVWPIDFGLIYSGNTKVSGRVTRAISSIESYLSSLTDFAKKYFKDKFKKDRVVPFFYKIMEEEKELGFWNRYLAILSIMGLDAMKRLKDTFVLGSPESLKAFFKSINLYNDMIHLLDASSPATDYVCDFLKEDTKKMNEDTGIATKVVGVGRGGDVLFIAPYGSFREYLFEIVDRMRTNMGRNIWVDYLSWEDGLGEAGLLFDQIIDRGMYSKFVSKGSISIRHLNDKGNLHTDLYTIQQLEKEQEEFDLLFDTTENDIIIKGRKLCSKEIHSAIATIEIFKILLENLDRDVKNCNLPRSSYSASRNEFHSKIILPLQKAMKKYYGKELNIILHGNIHNFTVKLESGNYHIHFIENRF